MPTVSPYFKTDEEKCVFCLACLRVCPTKAIMFPNNKAYVVEEKCIYCSSCLEVCAEKALSTINRIEEVKKILETKKAVAILAPEYAAAFHPAAPYQVEAALQRLGFYSVEDTLLAEELIAYEYEKYLKEATQTTIRSTCPVVVSWIEKFYPDLTSLLAPFLSAPLAMGKLVKELYGAEVSTVYIGPCVAQVIECLTESNSSIDEALTFKDLKNWLESSYINLLSLSQPGFAGLRPVLLRSFSLRGGFPREFLSKTSLLDRRIRVAHNLEEAENLLAAYYRQEIDPTLIDVLACYCCVDGPQIDSSLSLYARKKILENYYRQKSEESPKKVYLDQIISHLPYVDLKRNFRAQEACLPLPTEEELRKILASGGKTNRHDLLDCRACGYKTCKEKAVAIYQGLANWEMCFPFQKQLYVKVVEELKKLSISDGLTGLLNQPSFMKQLEIEFRRASRYRHTFSLIMLDIDNFKEINDRKGHLLGDFLLKEIAQYLKNSIRTTDILARYGGDEFIVLLAETGLGDALVVAEKLRKGLAKKEFKIGGEKLKITASLGITCFRAGVEDFLTLVDEADKALYISKEKGRNKTSLFSALLTAELPEKQLTEDDVRFLKEALKKLGLEEI